jgi:hypothetical protein
MENLLFILPLLIIIRFYQVNPIPKSLTIPINLIQLIRGSKFSLLAAIIMVIIGIFISFGRVTDTRGHIRNLLVDTKTKAKCFPILMEVVSRIVVDMVGRSFDKDS